MGILTKEVKIKLWGQNVKHYNSLGYIGKHGDTIVVKVEDLQDGSNVKIQYLCDYCGKEIITMVYADLKRRTKEVNKMACDNCRYEKQKETNQKKRKLFYDYEKDMRENKKISRTKEESSKMRHDTCIRKYGEFYRQQFSKKASETFFKKTGYDYPSQSPEVREKITQSYINHYGVNNPQCSSEIRNRTEKTNFKKYGCKAPSQNKEVQYKARRTMYENHTCMTSKQQDYIYSYYKTINEDIEINYPISSYSADICLPKEKIDIEIDFGGHNLSVKMGYTTQEEFNRKEMIRDFVVKKEGYKIMRIISSQDLLPSKETLFQMLEYTKKYFSNTSHTWINWNIDEFKMINAENKDINGVFINYGDLHRLKKSELTDIIACA